MKDEEMAEEIANKRCNEIMCYGHCNFNSPKHHRCGEWHREYNCALEGLKAGRPQWHKVADGDYPDTDRTVLAYSDDVVSGHYPYFAQYYKGFTNAKKNGVDLNWNCWRNNMQRELVEPTVWCEIPTFDKE